MLPLETLEHVLGYLSRDDLDVVLLASKFLCTTVKERFDHYPLRCVLRLCIYADRACTQLHGFSTRDIHHAELPRFLLHAAVASLDFYCALVMDSKLLELLAPLKRAWINGTCYFPERFASTDVARKAQHA